MDAYKKLEEVFLKLYRLEHLLALGQWDARVMMPPKGAAARGAAMGTLSHLIHSTLVSTQTKTLLEKAAAAKESLNPMDLANLREMQRTFDDASVLTAEFVERRARLTSQAPSLWATCRENNDFASFLPTLRQMVELAREEGRLRSSATGKPIYECLFSKFECGISLARLEEIFNDLKSWLPQLLRDVMENRKDIEASLVPLTGELDVAQQKKLCTHLARVWEFDFDAGRLDDSAHPFTGMVQEDSRMTTNYVAEDYRKAVFAAIHETGHSKYETHAGPIEKRGQPVCAYRSLSVHESQSRIQEVNIGRSAAFAEFLAPLMREYFGDNEAFTAENLRSFHQQVKPDFIRIRADEVCYPLHILLRYEIERALVEGTMQAEDLPRVWNEKMVSYLGIETTGRDDVGCLQDMHWAGGMFGYFPTYTLGSMFASQLMATITKELGEDTVNKCIRAGELGPIFARQDEKIWKQGCLYETEELMERATGERLNPKYFREHLERRYLRSED